VVERKGEHSAAAEVQHNRTRPAAEAGCCLLRLDRTAGIGLDGVSFVGRLCARFGAGIGARL
jgi:hypothetical protein